MVMVKPAIGAGQTQLRWRNRTEVQRYVRLLQRLVRMSPAEITYRLKLRRERRSADASAQHTTYLQQLESSAQRCGDHYGVDIIERLKSDFDRSFFFGPSSREAIVAVMRQRFADDNAWVVAQANALGQQGIDFLGLTVSCKAGIIDWQADPKSGQRRWSEGLLHEDAAIRVEDADVKYVWEVNRQQFLPILGRAYWLTGDEYYAQEAVALIDDWIAQNPIGYGVNWCSHLEVAMRSISWLWTMPFLLSWQGLESAFMHRWLASISAHYEHLQRHLSLYTDPTNHLIGEAAAIWLLSVCLPGLPNSQLRGGQTLKILTEELSRQVYADGVNKEQATSYHRFVLDFYLQVSILARRNQLAIDPAVERKLQSMLTFAAALAGLHGNSPMIGDSDDARGVPLLDYVGWDFRDVLSTGAVLYAKPEWKQQSSTLAAATVWLLGPDAGAAFDALTAASDDRRFVEFANGGYRFSRLGSPSQCAELIFDSGPLGLWPNAAHGHADALSVLVRVNGQFLLTDPGTGTYFSCAKIRDRLRQTSSHNTVTVDGLDQADIFDLFKWVNPMRVQTTQAIDDDGFHYLVGEHSGYRRLKKAVNHRRTVFKADEYGWVVVDRLTGSGRFTADRHFNFPAEVTLQSNQQGRVAAVDRTTGNGLGVIIAEAASAETRIAMEQDGVWSGQYGEWLPCYRLSVTNRVNKSAILFTFLQPLLDITDTQLPHSSVTMLDSGKAALCTITFSPQAPIAQMDCLCNPAGSELVLPDRAATNAEFLYVARSASGEVKQMFFVGQGCYLASAGKQFNTTSGQRFVSYRGD